MLLDDSWFEYHQKWICRNEDGTIASSAKEHVILEVTIDSSLTLYSHLKQLCKMVANKLNALSRIAPYFSHSQGRLIYNSFFTGELS